MKYDKVEVMEIVENVLGVNCNGLYINSSAIYDSVEQYIVTNFDKQMNPVGLDYDCSVYDVRTGASKLVIIPKNTSYVIKMPFTQSYCEFCKEECECKGQCIYEGTAFGCPDCSNYYYELGGDVNFDICAEENDIYERANEMTKKLLMPNIFIGLYNNCVPIYIQKKVITNKSFCYKRITALDRLSRYVAEKVECYLNYKALAQYLPILGIIKFREMCSNIAQIDDLHESNWGYNEDGTVAIIDYGGYDEEGLWG